MSDIAMQSLDIKMLFPVKMEPGNDNHLKACAISYFRGKGITATENPLTGQLEIT